MLIGQDHIMQPALLNRPRVTGELEQTTLSPSGSKLNNTTSHAPPLNFLCVHSLLIVEALIQSFPSPSMSLCTMSRPVTSSATLLRWVKPSAALRPPTLRCFSSYGNAHQSSKRDMQTATAYRPHTLPSSFPLPRGNGGLESSITADFPLPGEAKQSLPSQTEQPKTSVKTGDAQTVASTTGTTTTSKTGKPRRPLRARKAAMKLSPLATEQLRKLMDQPEPKYIRVGVKNRGCSGLAYHLEYVEKPAKFDEVVEQDGVKVLIDSKALFSIIGSEMDWHEDKLSQRFVFRNPNIKEECGCGESFMV